MQKTNVKLALTEKDTMLIKAIISANLPTAKGFIYGSRAGGKPRPFSDIDLAIDNGKPLSLREKSNLEAAFEESNLDYKVDCIDLTSINRSFVSKINSNLILL